MERQTTTFHNNIIELKKEKGTLSGISYQEEVSRQAFVTLLSSPSYIRAAVVLVQSLLWVNSTRTIVVAATEDCVESAQTWFSHLAPKVRVLAIKPVPPPENVPFHGNWAKTYPSIRIWELEEYDKVVFIDCDMIAIRNIDQLFEEHDISSTKVPRLFC